MKRSENERMMQSTTPSEIRKILINLDIPNLQVISPRDEDNEMLFSSIFAEGYLEVVGRTDADILQGLLPTNEYRLHPTMVATRKATFPSTEGVFTTLEFKMGNQPKGIALSFMREEFEGHEYLRVLILSFFFSELYELYELGDGKRIQEVFKQIEERFMFALRITPTAGGQKDINQYYRDMWFPLATRWLTRLIKKSSPIAVEQYATDIWIAMMDKMNGARDHVWDKSVSAHYTGDIVPSYETLK
ncbi:MAG: hypothetical protein WC045_00110 [Patescibacteria group bacterium]